MVYPYRNIFPIQTSDWSDIRNHLIFCTERNIPADARDFYLLQSVKIVSGVQTFNSLGTVVLSRDKTAGAWSRSLLTIWHRSYEECSFISALPLCLLGVQTYKGTPSPLSILRNCSKFGCVRQWHCAAYNQNDLLTGVSHPVKTYSAGQKSPNIYGSQNFIYVFTRSQTKTI